MKRVEFEHVIRAVADVIDDEMVVVGSQAVLASFPDAPESLLTSLELDVYPRTRPERSADIDGAIGDGSRFHETFGYYAQGVGPETATPPAGWEERLVRVEVPTVRRNKHSAVAWCLEPHDLVLAKLAAGREHDFRYVETAIRESIVDAETLMGRVALMPERARDLTQERLVGLLARIGRI